jgi:hypothetical protein
MIRPMMAVMEKMIPRNQTTYMFLGEHTQNTAGNVLRGYDVNSLNENKTSEFNSLQEKINYNLVLDSGNVIVGDAKSFHLSHFYPVLPRDYVVSSKKTVKKVLTKNAMIQKNKNRNRNRNNKNENKDKNVSSGKNDKYFDNINNENKSSKNDSNNNNNNNNNNNSSYDDSNTNINKDEVLSNHKNIQNIQNNDEEIKTEKNIDNTNNNNMNNNNNDNDNEIILTNTDEIDYEYIDDLYHPYFVMQGNFGGKHSHRKDPKGILNCLRLIEGKLKLKSIAIEKEQINEQLKEKEKEKEKEDKQSRKLSEFVKSSKINMKERIPEIISGNTRREIATEKMLLSTLANTSTTHTLVNEILPTPQAQHHTQSQSIENPQEKKTSNSNFQKKDNSNFILKNANFSPQKSALSSLSIDLVGHLNGEVNIGQLRTGKVRFLSDLNSREYYEAISRV